MLSLSNLDIAETLRLFASVGIDCTFLVPTQTALQKSIMDATDTVRVWLSENGYHDYAVQGQGQEHKAQIDTLILSRGQVAEAVASLYRPETKSGDPRIWFGRLGLYANPTDLLAICRLGKRLLVVNCSQCDIMRLLNDKSSTFWQVYRKGNPAIQNIAAISREQINELLKQPLVTADSGGSPTAPPSHGEEASEDNLKGAELSHPAQTLRVGNVDITPQALELLGLLKGIGAKGFVPTMRSGDTGVGFTLETLLGIKCNSSKAPDFKGVEIKAGRKSAHAAGRTTILSQVPDWSISRLKSTADILRERGRFHAVKRRRQLFHEMVATKVNSYGLSLKVDHGKETLHQIHTDTGLETIDTTWRLAKLFERLVEKHRQTFWIKADTRGKGDAESFHYAHARYTSGVSPSRFPMLLDAGVISLDFTIKELPSGQAKDQGYLFKIRQADLPLLFKSPQEFDLTT